MKYIVEVIHLRSGTIKNEKEIFAVYEKAKELLQKQLLLRFLKDTDILSDFLIVIEWKSQEVDFDKATFKSSLGIKIVSQLKKYGLVTHRTFLDEGLKNEYSVL